MRFSFLSVLYLLDLLALIGHCSSSIYLFQCISYTAFYITLTVYLSPFETDQGIDFIRCLNLSF